MIKFIRKINKQFFILVASLIICIGLAGHVFADLYINVLAVNGSEESVEQEIRYNLPKELSKEDVLEAAGLDLDYDINKGNYYVHGKIKLDGKESRTFKVRIRDVWLLDDKDVQNIKNEIDLSLNRIKETEYYEYGEIKKDSLNQRLDYIVEQQEQYADNIEKRIDNYRIYAGEIKNVRNNALSVKYWRSKPPSPEEAGIFTYIVEVENPSEAEVKKENTKHFLPKEVKPEHFVDLQGFDVRYDLKKAKPYLLKEEELQPSERKRYEIGIIDIWNVPLEDVEGLKDRTNEAYNLLKNSVYSESAEYLSSIIKVNLEKIELSQQIERNINDHIGAYRTNAKTFQTAKEDVLALERLLEALRENLERSKVKNVLQKIKTLKDLAKIAASLFKKPQIDTAWKIIMGIMIFVGLYTTVHFMLWSKRSRAVKIEEKEEEQEEGQEQKQEEKQE